MGISARIGNRRLPPLTYTVTEASSPVAVTDSTGQVGSFTIALAGLLDPSMALQYKDEPIVLSDTRRGTIEGTVLGVSIARDTGQVVLSCISRLGALNLYAVTAAPYSGTLEGALTYYFSLARLTNFRIDPRLAAKRVSLIGWTGELWYNLKMLASAHSFEMTLVSGVVLVRPLRERTAIRNRDVNRTISLPGTQTAAFVEVFEYETRRITGELLYPADGWSPEVPIISVNAGETVTQNLETQASVSYVAQPVCVTTVTRYHASSSVYTVSGSDGKPISPTAWRERGGSLSVTISEDQQSLVLRVTGPRGLSDAKGVELTSYSIAMSSGTSERYSSLRIVGEGVQFTKTKRRFATGVPLERAAQEVGITIDNPNLTSVQDVYDAGARAARAYSGRQMQLSASVTAINRLGDSGVMSRPTYKEVKAAFPGKTYAQVKAAYAGMSYADVGAQWSATTQDVFENQVFGNAGGARLHDDATGKKFRIRTANHTPGTTSVEADEDTLYADAKERFAGMTYAQVKAFYAGMTYRQAAFKGLA